MLREVAARCPRAARDARPRGGLGAPEARRPAALGRRRCTSVERALQFDDPINIQYTSGTTGFPKGATLTHHNILNNGYFIGEMLRYTEQDRVCIPVPFYHCFGMVLGNLACTTHGAAMVDPRRGFDPLAALETVQQERCTSLYGVPTMFIAELEHPDFSEVRLLVAAHRDHGRLALPGRGDEEGADGHAHAGGDDLLRHDRDLAGLDAVARPTTRSRSASPPSAASTRTSR